jgi:hypothetical protein
MRLFKSLFVAAIAMGLASCGVASAALGPPENLVPAAAADQTVLDEQVAISVELAYQAAVLTVSTATKAGLVKGATAEKLLAADNKAYQAVLAVRAAYDTGNARSYTEAATAAQNAIRQVVSLIATST